MFFSSVFGGRTEEESEADGGGGSVFLGRSLSEEVGRAGGGIVFFVRRGGQGQINFLGPKGPPRQATLPPK